MKKRSAFILSIVLLVLSFAVFGNPVLATSAEAQPTDAQTASFLNELSKADPSKAMAALQDPKNIAKIQKASAALTEAAAKVAKGEEVKDINTGDPEVDQIIKELASKENIETVKGSFGKVSEIVKKAQESLNNKDIEKEGKDPSAFFRAMGGEHRESLFTSFAADMGDLFGHFGTVQNEKDVERESGNLLMKIAAHYVPQIQAFEYKVEQEPSFFNEDTTVDMRFKVKMGPRLQRLLGMIGVGYDVVTDTAK